MKMSLLWPHDPAAEVVVEHPKPREVPKPRKGATTRDGKPIPSLRFPAPVASTITDEAGPVAWIVNSAGRLRKDEVFRKNRRIYAQFAEMGQTPAGALEFVRKFGLLHGADREQVDTIILEIGHMKQVIVMKLLQD